MKIFHHFDALERIKCPVLTIGTFDGVHLGHQRIIEQLNEEAKKIGGESVLFTFYPHPRMVLYPESHGLKLIQTQQEKLEKLAQFGLQNVIVYPFSFEFSRLSALEFVRDFLVNRLHVKKLVIGYDHQFGKNREGSISFLKEISETYDFEVIEISPQEVDSVNISSTKVREAILNGNLHVANSYLGYTFEFSGVVEQGDQLGRTLGYPTANVAVQDPTKLLPMNGVYAVRVYIDNEMHAGMMNRGVRPTLGHSDQQRIEVHVFDFQGSIYGKNVRIEVLQKAREEQSFGSLEGLKEQLKKDEIQIRSIHSTF